MPEFERFYSPDSLLASFFSEPDGTPRLILVTGESGSGKTTWCKALNARARESGLRPAGLTSPAVFESGNKVGIDLVEITTGVSKRLATRRAANPHAAGGRETLNWRFDDRVLAWGNELLDHLTSPELLILDELGPLELLENDGLTNGLKLVSERRYRLAAVVVRPSLLAIAQERWPEGTVLDLTGSISSVSGAAP